MNLAGVLYFVVIGGVFLASLLDVQSLFIAFFLLIAIATAVESPFYFVFLFSLFLPTNDIFPKEQFLFSIVGIKQILGAIMITLYLARMNEINRDFKQTAVFLQFGNLIRWIKRLIYVVLIYWIYTYFKNAYFGLHEFDLNVAILRSINIFLFLFSLIPFLKLACTYLDYRQFSTFVMFSIVNMLVFTFLSPYLPELGFKAIGTAETEFEVADFQRYAGIIADGDSNTLGVFFAMSIALLLLTYDKMRKLTFYPLLLLSFLSIALSGSRTAFISLVISLIAYFIFARSGQSNKLKALLIATIPIIIVLIFPFLELLLARLTLADEQLNTNTDTNRIGKWLLYINFYINHPITFITGAQQELRIAWNDTYYAAHNVYITMIYNGGVLFPLLFLRTLIRTVVTTFQRAATRDFIVLFIPFFLLGITVSDLGILYTFFLFSTCYIIYKSNDPLTKRSAGTNRGTHQSFPVGQIPDLKIK
jgi:hypothetical protein